MVDLMKPAHWWQFWRPGSGIVGGLIAGLIPAAIALAVLTWWWPHG